MTSSSPLFTWLDDHLPAYTWLALAVVAAATLLALVSWFRPLPSAGPKSDWRWGGVLLAVLAAGRWSSMLIPRELNPDESLLFAGAHTLPYDPVFWRSLDGTSSGPLNFFTLVPVGWVGGWDSFTSLRLTALLLLGASLTLIHQSLALVYPPRAVRLATLAAVVLEALTNSVDLLHLSTELVSVLWLSVAAYAAVRRWARGGGPAWSGLGGLMLGAVPMSKLQAAPLAMAAGAVWLWGEMRARHPAAPRHRLYLLAGAVLPSILLLTPVLIAGQWESFTFSYLQVNLGYAAAGDSSLASLYARFLAKSLEEDSLLHLWLPGMVAWCAFACRPRLPLGRPARTFTWLALGATAAAVFCVLHAGRPFLHYWQLVVPAATLLLGALLGNLATGESNTSRSRIDRWLMAACALALVGTLGEHRLRVRNYFLGAFTYYEAHPRNPVSDHVLAQARPGDTLAVWGWSNYLFVETGLRLALHNADIDRLVTPGPFQQLLRDRYLADMLVTRPALFVDSIGPCSIYFQTPEWTHERNFPGLGALVRSDYVLVDEVDGARIYRRRDLVAR